MSYTHWKKIKNPDYIGAYALQPGQDLTVKIKTAGRKEIVGEKGKKSEELVLTLEAPHKPMILNSTNAKSIAKLYGPYIEDWSGKSITLYASTTQLAGETVECLRIRPTVGKNQPRPIDEARLTKALQSIEQGTYTVAELVEKYALTDEQLARLPKQIESVQETPINEA